MDKKYSNLIVIIIVISCFIAYGRILGNGFIIFDDDAFIMKNSHIQSGINLDSIKWAFTTTYYSYWVPLSWISHALDWSLFGAKATGHHLISLLLHIISTLLLFLFLKRTTQSVWPSAFAALLFSLHPLRVESVAWAAERKDVLSLFFGLASIYVYSFYVEKYQLSKYFFCLILFALSLMAKPMMVSLPFVLLLLDYWPLSRWQKILNPVRLPEPADKKSKKKEMKRGKNISIEKKIVTPVTMRSPLIGRLFWEKIPFIVLTILISMVTVWAQNKEGATASISTLPFQVRAANAITTYVTYLGKFFWPFDLAIFYPYKVTFAWWQVFISCFVLIIMTMAVIYFLKKMPFLFVGWFWYLGTLIPVIGLVQVGKQALADRYTYLPSIGIVIMLIWGILNVIKGENISKKILFPAGISVLVILSFLTWKQCSYWENGIMLFGHALQVTKENALAHDSFATALAKEGRIEEAINHYSKTIDLYNNNIAICLLKGDHALSYKNRGICYAKLGRHGQAIEDYNEAIRLQPHYADVYYDRGNAYYNLGQYQQAIENFNEASRLKLDYFATYYNRGNSYLRLGQIEKAIGDYSEAIRLQPDFAGAYNNRGTLYFSQGKNELGCRDVQTACKMGICKMFEIARNKKFCNE